MDRSTRLPLPTKTTMTPAKPTRCPATATTEQYHGDLRKGAYLRRRAAYQMQAGSGSPYQAGALTAKHRNPG